VIHHTRNPLRGFSLIELLIVIILLGVLATIAIPQFANASAEAKEGSLATIVQTVRSQVAIYKLQHGDQLPDLAAASAGSDHFRPLLDTSVYGVPPQTYGPYLLSVPVNPVTQGSTVNNVASFDAAGNPDAVANSDFLYDYGAGAGSGMIWGTTNRATGTPLIQ
jgi:prepilin-type N-terminal cleavage/methylation domain-containing protein